MPSWAAIYHDFLGCLQHRLAGWILSMKGRLWVGMDRLILIRLGGGTLNNQLGAKTRTRWPRQLRQRRQHWCCHEAFDNQHANEAIGCRGWREERPTAPFIYAWGHFSAMHPPQYWSHCCHTGGMVQAWVGQYILKHKNFTMSDFCNHKANSS